MWIVEDEILSDESANNYKNLLDQDGKISGSKVTSINNVQELGTLLANPNIVLIVEVAENAQPPSKQEACIYCNRLHDEDIPCY